MTTRPTAARINYLKQEIKRRFAMYEEQVPNEFFIEVDALFSDLAAREEALRILEETLVHYSQTIVAKQAREALTKLEQMRKGWEK